MNVPGNLKKIRELKNLTQEYVGSRIGLSQSAYSKIESGESDISLSKIEQIAVVFGMQPEDIIFFNEQQIVFNITNNRNASGLTINNQVSKSEKKAYEDHIATLKEEIIYLKGVVNKFFENHKKIKRK